MIYKFVPGRIAANIFRVVRLAHFCWRRRRRRGAETFIPSDTSLTDTLPKGTLVPKAFTYCAIGVSGIETNSDHSIELILGLDKLGWFEHRDEVIPNQTHNNLSRPDAT